MGRISKILWFGIFAFCAGGLGCTRNGDKPAAVTISLSNVQDIVKARNVTRTSASSSACINRVMVNVSGPQVAGQLQVWQGNGNSSSSPCPTPQTDFTFNNIPSTATVIAQVMLIMQDSSGGMTFYYASQPNITPASVAGTGVTLAPTELGGLGAGQGQIVGRYLDSGDSTGLTGVVNLEYTPNTTDPAMVLDTEEIFGGWLGVFSPTGGAAFSYVYQDGTATGRILFTSGADSGSPLLTGNSQNFLANVPTTYHSWGGGSGDSNQSSVTIAGFFGSGAPAGAMACYNQPASASSDALNQVYTDNTMSTQVYWIGLPSAVSVSTPTSSQAYIGSGGASSGTNCPTSPNYAPTANGVYLNEQQIGSGGGGDSGVLGFNGPFLNLNSGGNGTQWLSATASGSQVVLTWSHFPAAITSAIAGADVFYSTSQTSTNSNPPWQSANGNGVQCGNLVGTGAGQFGFTQANTSPVSLSADTYTISGVTGYNSSTFAAVVCPYRTSTKGAKAYFNTAAYVSPGNGGGGGQELTLAWTADSTANTADTTYGSSNNTQSGSSNTCKAYDITLTGATISLSSPLTVNLSDQTSSNHLNFYTASGCTSPSLVTSLSLTSNTQTIWVSSSAFGSMGGFDVIQISTPGGNSGPQLYANIPIGIIGTGSPPAMGSAYWINASTNSSGQTAFVQNSCYELATEYQQSSGAAAFPSAATVTFSSSAGSFYSDPNCTTALSGSEVTVPANESIGTVYFKPTSVTSSGMIMASSSPTVSFGGSISFVTGGTTVTQVQIQGNGGSSFTAGNCTQLQFNFLNSVGSQVNNTPGVSGTLNLAGPADMSGFGAIYNNATCTGSPVTLPYSTTLSYSTNLSFMPPSAPTSGGEFDFIFSGTGVSGTSAFSNFLNASNPYMQVTPSTGLPMFYNDPIIGSPEVANWQHNTWYAVVVYLGQSSSQLVVYSNDVTVTLTPSSLGSAVTVFSLNSDGSNPQTSPNGTVVIPAGQNSAVIYVNPNTDAISSGICLGGSPPQMNFSAVDSASIPLSTGDAPFTYCAN